MDSRSDNNDNFNPNNNCLEKNLDDKNRREMEEEIEILYEQVESLKQLLHHENQLRNYYMQELDNVNKELEWMNDEIYNLIKAKTLTLDEALEFAKSILGKKQSASESLDELLKAIYKYPVKINEFEEIDGLSVRSKSNEVVAQGHEIQAQSVEIRANSSQIMTESYKITALSRELKVCSREIQVHSHDVRNRLRCKKVFRNTSQNRALYPTGTAPDFVRLSARSYIFKMPSGLTEKSDRLCNPWRWRISFAASSPLLIARSIKPQGNGIFTQSPAKMRLGT
jgi:hypothetical protein